MTDNTEVIRRASRAEQLLRDDMWKEAWDALQQTLTAKMIAAKTDEGTLRGKQLLGLMIDLRQYWESAIKNGAVAAAEIKLEEERKRRWWPTAA